MNPGILELNDHQLRIRSPSGEIYAESGFAQLTPGGIVTGETARALAWREPQHSQNQYWRQLNQTPLPGKHRWARHNADIAFAQLKNLHTHAESPERMILAVPGSCSDEQLSLLLGLCSALPTQVLAIVDSGLTNCLHLARESTFIDLHLHQTVVTRCAIENGALKIRDQLVLADIGVMQLHNAIARHISNLLIRDYRHDPLHSAEGEQAIYDGIPSWLDTLGWQDELEAQLPSAGSAMKFRLHKSDISAIFSQRLRNLERLLAESDKTMLLFASNAAPIQRLMEQFSDCAVADASICLDNCNAYLDRLITTTSEIQRIRLVQLKEIPPRDSIRQKTASHLLYEHRAWPLRSPLSISIEGSRIHVQHGRHEGAALVLVARSGRLELLHRDPDIDLQLPETAVSGALLHVAGHELRLIEVEDG